MWASIALHILLYRSHLILVGWAWKTLPLPTRANVFKNNCMTRSARILSDYRIGDEESFLPIFCCRWLAPESWSQALSIETFQLSHFGDHWWLLGWWLGSCDKLHLRTPSWSQLEHFGPGGRIDDLVRLFARSRFLVGDLAILWRMWMSTMRLRLE